MSKKDDFIVNGECDRIRTALKHCRTKSSDHPVDVAKILKAMQMKGVTCDTANAANNILATLIELFLDDENDRYLMFCMLALAPGYKELNVNSRRRKYINETGYVGTGKEFDKQSVASIEDEDEGMKKLCQNSEKKETKLISKLTEKIADFLKLDSEDGLDQDAVRELKDRLLQSRDKNNLTPTPLLTVAHAFSDTTQTEEDIELPNLSEHGIFANVDDNEADLAKNYEGVSRQSLLDIINSPVIPDPEKIPRLTYTDYPSVHDPRVDESLEDFRAILSGCNIDLYRSEDDKMIYRLRNSILKIGLDCLDKSYDDPDLDHAKSKDLYKATQYLLEAFRLGSAEAAYYIAEQYYLGTGLLKSDRAALGWLSTSADMNYYKAIQDLAICYEYGLLGAECSHAKATELLDRDIIQFTKFMPDFMTNLKPIIDDSDPLKVRYPKVFGVPVDKMMKESARG